MVTQKLISLRINTQTLWQVDQEAMLGWRKRNSIINEGARLYVNLMDARRNYRMYENPETKKKILKGFLKLWFPEAVDW